MSRQATTDDGGRPLILPPDPACVGQARRYVRELLADHPDADLVEAAVLCASELVSNAVLHARTAVELRVMLLPGGAVLVRVLDTAAVTARLAPHSPADDTDRGLALLASLSADWGVESEHHGGKVVWCLLTAGAGITSFPSDTGDIGDIDELERLLATWDDQATPRRRTHGAGFTRFHAGHRGTSG